MSIQGFDRRIRQKARPPAEFGLSVDNNVNWRIAQVSDGYPYYVHSITEHMLWAAFEDLDEVTELDWERFDIGLRGAVQSINAELRKPT